MLVITREVADSLIINGTTFTVVAVSEEYAKVTLHEAGRPSSQFTLLKGEYVKICHNVHVILIKVLENRIRPGFDHPKHVSILRPELERVALPFARAARFSKGTMRSAAWRNGQTFSQVALKS